MPREKQLRHDKNSTTTLHICLQEPETREGEGGGGNSAPLPVTEVYPEARNLVPSPASRYFARLDAAHGAALIPMYLE